MRGICACVVLIAAAMAAAQSPAPAPQVWTMQDSGTTAGLRGIDSVDGTVAWASGTGGTVLRTTNGGAHWTRCAVPDAAKDGATLDFRGVQAWDAQTAIVMASGPGDKSRLYKTMDGCRTWRLALKNPDKDGFWDALYFDHNSGWLLGDPVRGMFTLFVSSDAGRRWIRQHNEGLRATSSSQGAFAASNSSLVAIFGSAVFGAGGGSVYSLTEAEVCVDDCSLEESNLDGRKDKWERKPALSRGNADSSGVFSIGARRKLKGAPLGSTVLIAVGGDYTRPNESAGTAAWSSDGGAHWTASTIPPHGYRSAVQWSAPLQAWITVGTNGSDISRDGRFAAQHKNACSSHRLQYKTHPVAKRVDRAGTNIGDY